MAERHFIGFNESVFANLDKKKKYYIEVDGYGKVYVEEVIIPLNELQTRVIDVETNPISIADSSRDYLKFENGELSVKALVVTDVIVDEISLNMQQFVATRYQLGAEVQEGDIVILLNATDKNAKRWIHNGKTTKGVEDFSLIDSVLTSSEVRSYFSGAQGISYSQVSGEISIQNNSISQSKLDTNLNNKIVNGYAQTVGNGNLKTFTINHNLNTKDVIVMCYRISDGKSETYDVTRSSLNSVIVDLNRAPNQNDLRVMVTKIITA